MQSTPGSRLKLAPRRSLHSRIPQSRTGPPALPMPELLVLPGISRVSLDRWPPRRVAEYRRAGK